MQLKGIKAGLAVAAASFVIASPLLAQDLVRVANSQRGFWDQMLPDMGQQAGIFERHGIRLEILWTDGGADAQQAVISGAMDVAYGTGILGVISAWSQGAPIEIMGASMTGSNDLYWFARADSDIHTFADTDGKTVGFSRPGASTHLVAEQLVAHYGTSAELVPAGGPAANITQVMSGQIDVGWSVAPTGLDLEAAGQIRIIATGNDAPNVAGQTVRVHAVNRGFLDRNPDVVERYLRAMQETIEWAYTTDEAIEMWAAMHDLDPEVAAQAVAQIYPRESVTIFPIHKIEQTLDEAVQTRRLDSPMTEDEVEAMLRLSRELEAKLDG